MPKIALIVVGLFVILASTSPSLAKVKAVSTDGEATVYVSGDFSKDFDLKYQIDFNPAPANRSWSVVTILLVGVGRPAGSAAVGISRGYPNAATLSAFTTSQEPGKKARYDSLSMRCSLACAIEVRGDRHRLSALIEDKLIRTWSRSRLGIARPLVQLNAEVGEVGDSISALAVPIRAVVNGLPVRPSCAFTTQGVEPQSVGIGKIRFIGIRRVNARVTYLSLLTGKAIDACRSSRSSNISLVSTASCIGAMRPARRTLAMFCAIDKIA